MSRELPDWLDSYMLYTDSTESPDSYHRWCGLACIAGALQRKVCLKWGLGQVIYPNLYVVLVGVSGRTRKGIALGIAKDILKQVPGISIAPESSSGKQAHIMAMKRAFSEYPGLDGKIKAHCSLTAFSEELSVFLGEEDIRFLAALTDWYDSKDTWEYETISRGQDTLQGLCFNLIGGTAPDWLQSMLPQEALGGGFTARIIFVVEERKRKLVPEHRMSPDEIALGRALGRDLERISQLTGEMTLTKEAKTAYVNWYIAEDEKMNNGSLAVADSRFAGYCERRATHLRKLMLICSASRGDYLKIEIEDFNRALSFLLEAEKKMHKTFGGLGRAKDSNALEEIKTYIEKVGTTTRKLLLTRFYRDISVQDLKNVEEALVQMRMIKIKLVPETLDKVYTWIGGEEK